MPDDTELIYLMASALAMGGFVAQAVGMRAGAPCALAGVALAALGTLAGGRDGAMLMLAALTLALAVAVLGPMGRRLPRRARALMVALAIGVVCISLLAGWWMAHEAALASAALGALALTASFVLAGGEGRR